MKYKTHLIILVSTIILSFLNSCTNKTVVNLDDENRDIQYLDEIIVNEDNLQEIKQQLDSLHNIVQDQYKIGGGDIFSLHVYGEDDLATERIIVKPDGRISLKLIGEVNVGNLSINEATKLIENKLKVYLKFPKVSLLPVELSSSNFTIIGKVVHPGTYQIKKTRIVDALATSGGLATGIFQNNTVEMADLEHSYIVRNNRVLPVDFVEAVRKGNYLHNIPLVDGDYIYIPSSMNKEVTILGEVNFPGYVGFKESLTLVQALAYGQGLKDTAASQVIVVRGKLTHPRVFMIDISEIFNGEIKDFRLKPDDIIYVPKTVLADWNNILNLLIPSLDTVIKAKTGFGP